ncbi:MAG TPA: hypothetical protein VGI40_15075 [Pirellulaceae bacterium]|jgi:hypothetical protein
MIDEALDFLRLGKSRSNGHGNTAARPLVTGQDIHEIAKPAEHFIRQYPAAALATAFLVGVAIAWWIKRK